jgi:imidazolonepropionase-like amidohydrolase
MPGMLFNRMDVQIFKAVVEEAKAQGLPVACHTGDSNDVREAVAAGVTSIEHGSTRDRIPDELFAEMKAKGIAYVPTLSVMDAMRQFREGKTELLDRSLLQQAAPPEVLRATKAFLQNRGAAKTGMPIEYDVAVDNLKRAASAGVLTAVGSDAGNPLVVHGPTVQRELQLWVEAGLDAGVALQGATGNAAKVLRSDSRIGLVKKGYEATLLVVDGNPLKEIQAAERISSVIFKGERVVRADLFEQEK